MVYIEILVKVAETARETISEQKLAEEIQAIMRTLADQGLADADQALANARGSEEPHIGLRIAANEYSKAARKFDKAVDDLSKKMIPPKNKIKDCYTKELACLEAAVTIFSQVGDSKPAKDYIGKYVEAVKKCNDWYIDKNEVGGLELHQAAVNFVEPYGVSRKALTSWGQASEDDRSSDTSQSSGTAWSGHWQRMMPH